MITKDIEKVPECYMIMPYKSYPQTSEVKNWKKCCNLYEECFDLSVKRRKLLSKEINDFLTKKI